MPSEAIFTLLTILTLKVLSVKTEETQNLLQCIGEQCITCYPENSVCGGDNQFFNKIDCCAGTTCRPIPGLVNHHCRPNNNDCKSDSDCDTDHSGLRCLLRLDKCGLCKEDGELCELIHDTYECCSNFCDISLFPKLNNTGRCINLFPFSANLV
jgi:hypothetical protein